LKISAFGLGRGGEARVSGEAFLGFGCGFFFPEGWMGYGFRRVMILFLFFACQGGEANFLLIFPPSFLSLFLYVFPLHLPLYVLCSFMFPNNSQ